MTVLANVPILDVFQYNLVDNIFSFTVAAMGAAAFFLYNSRSQVAPRFRPALLVSGLVVSIACYHYFMIRHSWQDAYEFAAGKYAPTGKSFNDFYRYADWILTVPLLMVELVAVLGLTKAVSRPLLGKLVIAAALMIGLGYPGEVISTPDRWTERVIWGALSCIPFFYILYVLWVELTKSLDTQPEQAKKLIGMARMVILITWSFYPIAYALGGTTAALTAKAGGGGDANYVVALQIGYALADITAKAGFGILIYFIARAKTDALTESGELVDGVPVAALA
ncbi:MAG: bacteriorhodopsin-like [Sphaerospermopsis kisseleviana]